LTLYTEPSYCNNTQPVSKPCSPPSSIHLQTHHLSPNPTPPTPDQHQTWRDLNDYAVSLYYTRKSPAKAEHLLRRALLSFSTAFSRTHLDTLHVAQNLARLLRDRAQYAEAEPLARECSEVLAESDDVGIEDKVEAWRNLAIILQWQEKFLEALIWARRARDGWRERAVEGVGLERFELHVAQLGELVAWEGATVATVASGTA
jgi:tetratricopeptide (TPR) repeat protein